MTEEMQSRLDAFTGEVDSVLSENRSEIDHLNDENDRLRKVVDGLKDQIAQMREAVQPVLACEVEEFDVDSSDLQGDSEMGVTIEYGSSTRGPERLCEAHNAVRRAREIMAKDPEQFHFDYYITRCNWQDVTIGCLCKALDPILDLKVNESTTRDELSNAIRRCREIEKANEDTFRRIGEKHKEIKRIMESRGEW